MGRKCALFFDILLVLAAAAVCVYTFALQKRIAYFAAIVAVCGTVAFLARDLWALKNGKKQTKKGAVGSVPIVLLCGLT